MLIDNVTITIKAGDGGNGAATFKRNAQTARGGPDGGNGGNGGSIYVVGTDDLTALSAFQYKKHVKANDGQPGRHQNLFGRNADALRIKVPAGTRVTDLTTNETHEIEKNTPPILLARGGKGGKGNNEFKTATLQAPKFAEPGEKGEEKQIQLELRLIADVGFIGLPNAGKSSLLEALTNARPKIANYPFTTLEPNLGMLGKITLADIPGLIEGASHGKGLGIKFLKHIEKTKLLIHCIDSTVENPLQTYETVRREFEGYNKSLLDKPEIIFLTKVDLITPSLLNARIEMLDQLEREVITVSIHDLDSIERAEAYIRNLITI